MTLFKVIGVSSSPSLSHGNVNEDEDGDEDEDENEDENVDEKWGMKMKMKIKMKMKMEMKMKMRNGDENKDENEDENPSITTHNPAASINPTTPANCMYYIFCFSFKF